MTKVKLKTKRHCHLRLDKKVVRKGEWVVILFEDGKDVGDRWNYTLAQATVVMEAWIRDGVMLDEVFLNN